MPIESLPESTTRAIGSVLVLTDSCSVVKELVDNALDAKATIVTAELSSNALDVIQVKDNGIGIAPVDRELVCRRHCTSKIKTIEELSRLGGTSLGFRGEALSSIAALSSGLKVTTKIDGEVVAETLSFTRAGELSRYLSSTQISMLLFLTTFIVPAGLHIQREQQSEFMTFSHMCPYDMRLHSRRRRKLLTM